MVEDRVNVKTCIYVKRKKKIGFGPVPVPSKLTIDQAVNFIVKMIIGAPSVRKEQFKKKITKTQARDKRILTY